ncbi:hypothetical protein [Microbacterium sp. CJ88]|uniref:hypothetical protein n=1 Tax=Microbacterium sp. CJ88 TaxID=3445672 RepID=UPI003F65BD43
MLESYAAEIVFRAEQAELPQRLRRARSLADRDEARAFANEVAPVFRRSAALRRARRAASWPRPIAVHLAPVAVA